MLLSYNVDVETYDKITVAEKIWDRQVVILDEVSYIEYSYYLKYTCILTQVILW